MKTLTKSSAALALHGGRPVVHDSKNTVWRWPVFGREERAAVNRVLDWYAGYLYQEMIPFEKELCEYFGCKHALSHTNGTAAIHAAFHAVGLQPGDEVITPSYTYWATALEVRLCGAVPVFADVCRSTANIDPEDIARKITPRTKAIIVTHLWGMPCEMTDILEIARRHKLRVIEDASHAHGAEYRGRKIGTWGDVGCFSMQGSKLMPAIEGGFLLTNDADIYAKALALGHYGRVPAEHPWHALNGTGLGYKYRIHPVATALARVRLRKLDRQNNFIRRRVRKVTEALESLPGIEPFPVPSHLKRVYYQFEVVYNEKATGVPKDRILKALVAEGAQVVNERYPLQHRQEVYRRPEFWTRLPALPAALPVSETLHESIIQIPIFGTCEERIVDQYIRAFQKVWRHLDEFK